MSAGASASIAHGEDAPERSIVVSMIIDIGSGRARGLGGQCSSGNCGVRASVPGHAATVMHAHTRANMSPRCSLRSYVLRVVVLLAIICTNVQAFAIRSTFNTTKIPVQDLSVDESLQLEVRHDFKRPNDLNASISNKTNEISTSTTDSTNNGNTSTSSFPPMATTVKYNPNVIADIIKNKMSKKNYISERSIVRENTTVNLNTKMTKQPRLSQSQAITKNDTSYAYLDLTRATHQPADMDNSMSVEHIKVRAVDDTSSFVDKGIVLNDTSKQIAERNQLPPKSTKYANTLEEKNISVSPVVNSSDYDDIITKLPTRKYIGRERKSNTTNDKTPLAAAEYGEKDKAETHVTLAASAASDEMLKKVATEYFTATTPTSQFNVLFSTSSSPEILVTKEMENITNSYEVALQKPKLESVTSKRAGFLNLSSESIQNESTRENYTTEAAYRTTLTFENNLDVYTSRNIIGVSRSQSYLDEDAIKEEMLQETSLKNNEEMAKQNREGRGNNTDSTFSFLEQLSVFTSTQDLEGNLQTNTEEIVNTKPSQDKGKSTVVYTVSPNYKPMKKLEIQPPKQFVRDPDDNSWRNESISSLGIVFKPKNSSKPFTQVLKNKTETEWSNLLSKDNKSDTPDLRERLEKIAQKRKSKKKKTDLLGNIIYTDYEESNSSEEITNTRNIEMIHTVEGTLEDTTIPNISEETVSQLSTLTLTTSPITSTTPIDATIITIEATTELKTKITPTAPPTHPNVTSRNFNDTKDILPGKLKYNSSALEKDQKYFNVFDDYDISNEDESEYLQLAKLELKKYSIPNHITERPFVTTPPLPYQFTKPEMQYMPERKATVQYFPPRNTQKTKLNRFDDEFESKIKSHTKISSAKEVTSFSLTNAPDTPLGKYSSRYPDERSHLNPNHANTFAPIETTNIYNTNDYTKYLSHTDPPRITTEQKIKYGTSDHTEGFHRPSYVIKNYKDFLEQAAKDYDYERDAGFITYTQAPIRGVTISDLLTQEKGRPNTNFNEDYDAKFRKDVLQRFVDNFNHNDARYNANFPVLYNNSVTHVNVAGNSEAAAASRAFLKGLYSPLNTKSGYARREPYDPNCDKVTVELSPAYELHYYVPEQEEREEIEPKPVS